MINPPGGNAPQSDRESRSRDWRCHCLGRRVVFVSWRSCTSPPPPAVCPSSRFTVSLGCMTFPPGCSTRGSRCLSVPLGDFSHFLYGVLSVRVCVRARACVFFLLPLVLFFSSLSFPCGFSPPCRTPACQLPLLVGCPSLCRPSPGSRRVARLPTKRENSKSCRTLRGSFDR